MACSRNCCNTRHNSVVCKIPKHGKLDTSFYAVRTCAYLWKWGPQEKDNVNGKDSFINPKAIINTATLKNELTDTFSLAHALRRFDSEVFAFMFLLLWCRTKMCKGQSLPCKDDKCQPGTGRALGGTPGSYPWLTCRTSVSTWHPTCFDRRFTVEERKCNLC